MITKPDTLHIIGGGLAGTEAAWQALSQGIKVVLHEMRPHKKSEAHKTGQLAELVCSNSLKSLDGASASGRLKEEMSGFKSLVVEAAHHAKVPAGAALAVDREVFSEFITERLRSHPLFSCSEEEVTNLPDQKQLEANNSALIIATGPLTSDGLTDELSKLCGGEKKLYFYDAIAPVLSADSLDMEHCFFQDRYGKGEGEGDYLNLPLSKAQYEEFIKDVQESEKVPLHSFEKTAYFECCLPIEVMVERGPETLRFGPMKPVGITDPKTGHRPWANIQLRLENNQRTMFSMVGFQTKMKWPEQKRVFSKIPALRNAEFLRFGSVHRNTYVQSPDILGPQLEVRSSPRIRLAGQITGVEGYTESAAIGLLAGRASAAMIQKKDFRMPPQGTVMGALAHYVSFGGNGKFSPMNANLGLLPGIPKTKGQSKSDRKKLQCERAKDLFETYMDETGIIN